MSQESGDIMTNQEDGSLLKMVKVSGQRTWVSDPKSYIKLYTERIPELILLKTPAVKLFFHILATVKPKQDHIIISPVIVAKELGYNTTKRIHDGIKELIKIKIIAKTNKHTIYWINPNIFFNGDRRSLLK